MDYEVKNATIGYTNLGAQHTDHGFLSFTIGLDYGGEGQGCRFFSTPIARYQRSGKLGTPLAGSLLLGIDEVFGVDWEDLKGMPCRALAGWGGVAAIGNYLKDKWLWFDRSDGEFRVTSFAEIVAPVKRE